MPVAPNCNIQCNYCVRRFDCVNESRPGVTSKVLSPEAAAARYLEAKRSIPKLTVAGIAGPGDALANWPSVKATFQRIKAIDPEVQFCLSTNGLLLPELADEIKAVGVQFLTVTVNALEPEIGAQIYRHVYWQGERIDGEAGFRVLSRQQQTGLQRAVKLGLVCKINTVVIPGVNDESIEPIAEIAGRLGCYLFNAMPLLPVTGSLFEKAPLLEEKKLQSIRQQCGVFIKQMQHCQRCRADAVGCLTGEENGF